MDVTTYVLNVLIEFAMIATCHQHDFAILAMWKDTPEILGDILVATTIIIRNLHIGK